VRLTRDCLSDRNLEERYVAAAKALNKEEGILEVDAGALVSHSEEGAYVQAWVWVSDPDS